MEGIEDSLVLYTMNKNRDDSSPALREYILDRGHLRFTLYYQISLSFIFKWSCGALYCTKGGTCYSRGAPVAEGTECGFRKVKNIKANR